ncbi:MAG: bifunctional DNA-formamidopyrimidine glycosylase/DNA-(apurinic or apyrimidinic site) lyase [Actinomycetes bacterium]
MPELPEVETVRRGIDERVVGRVITNVKVGRERSVRRVGREAVIHGLTGTTMLNARRRGKYLLCDLDSGDEVMIHLRMSGRVLVEPAGTERPPHTHVVLTLAPRNGVVDEMWFVDPRTFGEVVVFDPTRTAEVLPELARLGPDPITDEFNAEVLANQLKGKRGALKPLLLNQHVVAGVGNIYADEVLHRSKLRWDRTADSLSRKQVALLAASIVEILTEAIAAGGSTLVDTQYVDIEGNVGSFQENHRVYGRVGQGCLTCGKTSIRKVVVAGRSTSFCPRCQK